MSLEIYNPQLPAESAPGTSLRAVMAAEIDVQIATAKQYPRKIGEFVERSTAAATATPDVARSMGYAIPRGGKSITGPSVRLAEIVAANWGNLRVAARVVAVEGNEVVAVCQAHDLESNVAIQKEARRRITDRNGRRYDDDMIRVTGAAAAAVAFREAIFTLVPRAIVEPIYQAAMKGPPSRPGAAAVPAIEDRRKSALAYFAKGGIKQETILKHFGVKSSNELDEEAITEMSGWKTAIQTGEISAAGLLAELLGANGGTDTMDQLKGATT